GKNNRPMNSKKYLVLLLGLLVMPGCSSDNKNTDAGNEVSENRQASETVEQIDPYSATLYPAKKEAKAQNFTVDLLNGGTFQLSEQRGKVVIMNIWATWCAPCHDETPDFVDLYNEYKDQGLVILGVSTDEQGKSVVKPFMEKYSVNYPMVIDDGKIMDKYGPTMGIPTTYIIDKKGNLQYFAVGALTKKELEPRINRLLNE
ncbi:MAG: TlpA disulfide reductase family protein, partial [Candidatus Halalkalibacterium sp. M3_1C_030]